MPVIRPSSDSRNNYNEIEKGRNIIPAFYVFIKDKIYIPVL